MKNFCSVKDKVNRMRKQVIDLEKIFAKHLIKHWHPKHIYIKKKPNLKRASQVALVVKNPPANAGDMKT